VALLVSALLASLPLMLIAWMTSGAWSPSRVRWQDLVLVFPMLLAVKLGLGRAAALGASFLTYWAIAFALLAWYIRTTGLQTRAARNHRSEV
jgi:hypothetical protein